MQVDNAYKMVHKPATVSEFIARLMGKRELSMADCASVDKKVRSSKAAWKITAKHTSREYRLRGIDSVPVGQSMFTEGEGEDARTRSVLDYFKERYPNFSFREDLPCVCVGPSKDPHKIRIPMDLLSLSPVRLGAHTLMIHALPAAASSPPPVAEAYLCACACVIAVPSRNGGLVSPVGDD